MSVTSLPENVSIGHNGTVAMTEIYGMDATALQELHVQRELLDRPPFNAPMKKLVDAFKCVEQGRVSVGTGTEAVRTPHWIVQGSKHTNYVVTNDGCNCAHGLHSHKTKYGCYHSVAAELYQRWQRAMQPMLALPLGPSTPDEHLAQTAQIAPGSTITTTDAPTDVSTSEPILEAPDASEEPIMATPQIADPFIPEPTPEPTPAPAQHTEAAMAALDAWYGQPIEPSYVAHDRIERSPQVGILMAALARAQARMVNPSFDSANPHFKTRYASLAAVRDAITPPLAAESIAVTQLPSSTEGWVCVTTGLWHASGQYLCSTLRLPVTKSDPQGYGTALTYARRYGLQAICNVAGDEDDDAESLRGKEPSKGAANGKPQAAENPVLRQEIAKALATLGFQGKTKADYEAEVQRRTGLALVPEHYAQVMEKLRTAVETQAA